MVSDVLFNKAATIERCITRIREEYCKDPDSFNIDFTRQDSVILNIQRACEASLDMGQHVIRMQKLGLPQSSRDVFQLLWQAQIIDQELSEHLKKMVGFRNIAVHDYQKLQLPIVVSIIEKHLDDFLLFSKTLIHLEL